MRSLLTEPVSSALSRAGALGAEDAVLSMTSRANVVGVLKLPARSSKRALMALLYVVLATRSVVGVSQSHTCRASKREAPARSIWAASFGSHHTW
jgi:hypothetical protein